MLVVLVERKQQKRCPSSGGKLNVEVLVLETIDMWWCSGGGRDKLNAIK